MNYMFDESDNAKKYLKQHGISKENEIQAKDILSKQLFINTLETCKRLGSDHVQIENILPSNQAVFARSFEELTQNDQQEILNISDK